MRAKAVDFKVTYINLREKPDWFLKISPHGKVPVLSVDEDALFESNAIAEYLDETVAPRLHPQDAIKRARNRAWTDFVPDFASSLSGVQVSEHLPKLSQQMHRATLVRSMRHGVNNAHEYHRAAPASIGHQSTPLPAWTCIM